MIYLRKRIFLFLILIIAFSSVDGQTVRKIAIRHKLSTESGLSSYNVNKILQDPYGYIWLGTQDGLNRFDGRNFIIYSRSSDSVHRLLGNVINDMVLDTSRKLLWVTTSYGGLNGIDLLTGRVTHSMKSSAHKDKFPNEWLKCLSIASGRLWIGSLYGLQVYDPDQKSFVNIDRSDNRQNELSGNVSFIYPDAYGHVWVYFPQFGIVVFDAVSGRILKKHPASTLGTNEILSFLQFSSRFIAWASNQFLWATDHGFRLLTYDREGNIISSDGQLPINSAFGNKTIFSCAKDPQGNLWFSTFEHLYVWDPRGNTHQMIEDIVYTPTNDYLNSVMHIFFDSDDNLWLGTQYGAGVCDYRQPSIVPYYRDRQSEVQINHAFFVLPANDSIVYVAAQHGAFAVNKRSGRIAMLSPSRRFNFIFRSPGGHYIFSNDQGLQVLRNGKLQPVATLYPELSSIQHHMLNGAIQSGDSLLLLSSEKTSEVFRWNFLKRRLTPFSVSSGNHERGIINTLYLDRDNTAWLLFDNAITTYNITTGQEGTLQLKDPELGIPMNIYMDMCEMQGDYWIAVYGKGVLRMDKNGTIKKIYGVREGLANTGAYTVVPYRDSLLFVTTNFGLYTIEPATDRIGQYLVSDGLNTNNFEENCGIAAGDEIIIGGEQGISVIHPGYFHQRNNAAPIYINNIHSEKERGVEDTFHLFINRITIGNDVKQATISFAALDYAHPEKIKYAYRIPQLSTGWIELGTQNFINLIGLMPGNYTLEVKAANENGVESMAAGLLLDVAPKWYQTLLFKILVFLAVAGILYSLYRYRIAQIRKQEQIRREIATDLHDDIGSTLNSAKIFAHLAKKDEHRLTHLEMIEQALTTASVGLRDIIWLLDDSRDSFADLIERINRFAQPITEAQGITLHSTMDPELADRKFSKTEKKTFFLIAKEAINNSIKHSGCSTITYELKPDGNAHMLTVSDDGKGFDRSTANGGNGLGNMNYRAEKIGYHMELDSSPGKGVRLTLKKR